MDCPWVRAEARVYMPAEEAGERAPTIRERHGLLVEFSGAQNVQSPEGTPSVLRMSHA